MEKIIASNLIEIRQARQLSRAQLSRQVGMSRAHYNFVERGHKQPTLLILERISRGLDIGLGRLVTKSNFLFEDQFIRIVKHFVPQLNQEQREYILKTVKAAGGF